MVVASSFANHPALGEPGPANQRAEAPRPKPTVSIERLDCALVAADEVLALVKIELRGQLIDAATGDADYRIAVTCSGNRVAAIASAVDGAVREHDTDLTGVSPSVRPRIVALAIAELVHELELTPRETTPEAPRLPPERREPPVDVPAVAPTRAIDLTAFVQTSTFHFDEKWLFGGGLGGSYSSGLFVAGLDAAIAARDERSEAGAAQVLLTHLSPYAGWRAVARRMTVELGAGYALGVARITGHATDARAQSGTVSEIWGAPFAFGALAYAASDTVGIRLRAHAGWVTLPVVGLVWRGPAIDLTGSWTGAQLAISLKL